MKTFQLTLRTVTPTFCRGRDQTTAELRPAAIKGPLRWWYRVWHPLAVLGPGDGPWAEGRVMGGTQPHTGQSPFLLRLTPKAELKTIGWSEIERAAPKGGRTQVGGIRYLGFGFREVKSDRGESASGEHRAIDQNVPFEAIHHFPRPADVTDETVRGLVAAWWLLTTLGGIGARARRGFGSLALEAWDWPGHQNLLAELPLPSRAASDTDWTSALLSGLNTLERWRGQGSWPDVYPHPNLGRGTEVVAQLDPAWRRAMDALEGAGRTLAIGRRENRDPPAEVDGRVTVGLPLTTGRRPTRTWRPGSWRTERIETDRHASPLHIHVAAFEGGHGLTWTRLAGPVPGLGQYRVREEGSRETFRSPAFDTLDALVQSLEGVRWTVGGAS